MIRQIRRFTVAAALAGAATVGLHPGILGGLRPAPMALYHFDFARFGNIRTVSATSIRGVRHHSGDRPRGRRVTRR